jgi:hypothetical protein
VIAFPASHFYQPFFFNKMRATMRQSVASAASEASMSSEVEQDRTDDMNVALARIERELKIADAPETAWLCLRKSSCFRRSLLYAVMWNGTSAILLTLLLLSAAVLASYDPLSAGSNSSRTIIAFTAALNAIFALEVVAKCVAFGLWGKGSYLSDPWNWLAVITVVLSYIPGYGELSALRLLRILEWMYAVKGFRIVLKTCVSSLPGMQSVLLLSVMTYVVRQ